jgi:hypothetical protein
MQALVLYRNSRFLVSEELSNYQNNLYFLLGGKSQLPLESLNRLQSCLIDVANQLTTQNAESNKKNIPSTPVLTLRGKSYR